MKKTIGIAIFCVGAVGLALLAYFLLRTPKPVLKVDGEGQLRIEHLGSPKEGDAYTIIWETDAGCLDTVGEALLMSSSKEGYYLYTASDGQVLWNEEDADGHRYTTATIRAFAFPYKDWPSHKSDDDFCIGEITVTRQEGLVVQAPDRRFGNPVREGGEPDWSQIVVLDDQHHYCTLRYRTGRELGKNEVFGWQTNMKMLTKASVQAAPFYVMGKYNWGPYVFDTDTVCFDITHYDGLYLDDTPQVESGETAVIRIRAFGIDQKVSREDSPDLDGIRGEAELEIRYQPQNPPYTIVSSE